MSERATTGKFELLYSCVFDRVVGGHFRPGDRIGIKDLAVQLKVSPTPLREILSRLVARGIVEERRSEGYYLARLDAQDIIDFLRMHELCIQLAVKKVGFAPVGHSECADGWCFLAFLARATGDNAILETCAMLGDRLAIIRRVEKIVIPESESSKPWLSPAALTDQRSLKSFVRQFHAIRLAAASSLALHITRGIRP